MPSSLLLSRRFAPLFWCQFFAAFNDNFLKTSLVFVVLFHSNARDAEALITFASAVFIAPYFFMSALGGELADQIPHLDLLRAEREVHGWRLPSGNPFPTTRARLHG